MSWLDERDEIEEQYNADLMREEQDFTINLEAELDREDDLNDWLDEEWVTDHDREMAKRHEAGLGTPYHHVSVPMPERETFGVIFKAELRGEHNFVFPCWPLPVNTGGVTNSYHFDNPTLNQWWREDRFPPAWVDILATELWKIPGCSLVALSKDEICIHTNGVISDEEVAVMVREITIPTLHIRRMELQTA